VLFAEVRQIPTTFVSHHNWTPLASNDTSFKNYLANKCNSPQWYAIALISSLLRFLTRAGCSPNKHPKTVEDKYTRSKYTFRKKSTSLQMLAGYPNQN
jgi:hypothetical protein